MQADRSFSEIICPVLCFHLQVWESSCAPLWQISPLEWNFDTGVWIGKTHVCTQLIRQQMSSHVAKLFVISYIDTCSLVANWPGELTTLALLWVVCAVSQQPICVTAVLGPGFHFWLIFGGFLKASSCPNRASSARVPPCRKQCCWLHLIVHVDTNSRPGRPFSVLHRDAVSNAWLH